MAKYYGKVGYIEMVETVPGVHVPKVTEKMVYGDIIRNQRSYQPSGDQVNANLNINNQISIVADAYAWKNFHKLKFIHWMGARWNITNVEVQRPRLILTIGGVYDGPEATETA